MTTPATTDIVDARTPAEAKRHWMIDRLWTMAMASFALTLFVTCVIWLGAWSPAREAQRLSWLGYALVGTILMQMAVAMAFALGGPVGRWRARWGDKSFGADDDETAAKQAYDGGGT